MIDGISANNPDEGSINGNGRYVMLHPPTRCFCL
eukprot:COSAG03_NODE_11804_length_575_cov_1.075630_1_plen_33_part_01